MGVKVVVGFTVEVSEGIGVIVETAITLFPILQLARTKKHHKNSRILFATMLTSVIISLLSLYLNFYAPNGVRYPLVGETRQRHFSGINFKPRNVPNNAHAAEQQFHQSGARCVGQPSQPHASSK